LLVWVDTCNAAANSHQLFEAAEPSESTELLIHEPAGQSSAADELGEPELAHEWHGQVCSFSAQIY